MYNENNQHNTQVKTMRPFKTNSNKRWKRVLKLMGFMGAHLFFGHIYKHHNYIYLFRHRNLMCYSKSSSKQSQRITTLPVPKGWHDINLKKNLRKLHLQLFPYILKLTEIFILFGISLSVLGQMTRTDSESAQS